MKVVKTIKREGWPVFTKSGSISAKYKKAHKIANQVTLKKMGAKMAKQVNKIRVPKNELLGSHTKQGKILVSSRVPKKLRGAVACHEEVEHDIMMKKKRGKK